MDHTCAQVRRVDVDTQTYKDIRTLSDFDYSKLLVELPLTFMIRLSSFLTIFVTATRYAARRHARSD